MFFWFFVFLALFIDLLTDQVQPLFKNSQVAAPPSTRTSCGGPRPVICCCRWKRCGGNGRTGKRGDIHLHKILIPFDASCFWNIPFCWTNESFFFLEPLTVVRKSCRRKTRKPKKSPCKTNWTVRTVGICCANGAGWRWTWSKPVNWWGKNWKSISSVKPGGGWGR